MWHWFESLFRRDRCEKKLEKELSFHIEQITEDYIAEGYTPEEARRKARFEFGGKDQVKEECRDIQPFCFLWDIGRDLRVGLRMLRRKPGFTLTVVLTMALGIGVNATIFSLIKGNIFRSYPYPESNRLAYVIVGSFSDDFPVRISPSCDYTFFQDIKEANRSFKELEYFRSLTLNYAGEGFPEKLEVVQASVGIFDLLKSRAKYGRVFIAGEDQPGNDRVAVLSHRLWQRKFDGDKNVLGKTFKLDDVSYTVIGIMPKDFFFPDLRPELWISGSRDSFKNASGRAIGRLKAGVSIELANQDFAIIKSALDEKYLVDRGRFKTFGNMVVSENSNIILKCLNFKYAGMDPKLSGRFFIMIYLAGTFVLLIACVNITNMLLARAGGRRQEIAVRMALGGSRKRLVRQLLTESVLLTSIGGLGGILLAFWSYKIILTKVMSQTPLYPMSFDMTSLIYALVLAVLTGLMFGVMPAFRSTGRHTADTFKEGNTMSSGRRRHRMMNVFLAGEIAMVTVLLICSGLIIQKIANQGAVEPGFDPENLLAVHMELPRYKYRNQDQKIAFVQEMLERTKSIPQITGVAAASDLPLFYSFYSTSTFTLHGEQISSQDKPQANLSSVTPDYFRILGIPLLSGRFFSEFETKTHPIIINQAMAEKYFNDDPEPIGRQIHTIFRFNKIGISYEPQWMEIVGVVGNVRDLSLGTPQEPTIYTLYNDYYVDGSLVGASLNPAGGTNWIQPVVWAVKTDGNPDSIVKALTNVIRSIDPELPLLNVKSMEQVLEEQRPIPSSDRLIGILSILALILAAVGIYGLTSYTVSERAREIGIRRTFGARPANIYFLILGRGLVLMLIGLFLGAAGALTGLKLLDSKLFEGLGSIRPFWGVSAETPFAYVGAAIVLLFVGIGAMFLSARRSIDLDPMRVLRE